MFKQIDAWHKTSVGYLVFAAVELGLTYGFASIAIDSGNLFWYALTLIAAIGFVQNFIKLIWGATRHGR
ncbi:hypothetical protein H7171_00120 [Candidatus Saccharibacteria bacterium]|nr:hypothetical protein [Candidatus Saccharibacteria bacterium]